MSSEPNKGSGDDAFRDLVVGVLERLDREGPNALEAACEEHPELAERLRERVGALLEFGLVGRRDESESVGEFQLVERIGAGGMGVVYRARQESLGREVAVKLIRPEILDMARARERFERETAVIARLQHPGIVPIYSVGHEAERPFYAMEWVRGCTLEQALLELEGKRPAELDGRDLLRAVLQRSPDEAKAEEPDEELFGGTWEEACLRVVRQVADALEHAHQRGVLHRDVKPGNVLLTPGGRVMLVDFGLSQVEGENTLTGSHERLGSVHFMSPELLRTGPQGLDARSDVYSLGVTLFRLLTLEQPFSGASEVAVMQQVLEGLPRRPREHLSSISWEAETVCLAAMDRDPQRRYQTSAAFSRDLANALARRPVEARRASLRLRTWRWVERRPGEAMALGLAVLLIVSIPSLIAWFQSREADRARTALADVRDEQARTEQQRIQAVAARQQAEAERTRAQDNYELALGTVDTLLFKLAEQRLDRVPGMVGLRGELAGEAADVYEKLREHQADDPELARLAAASERLRAQSLAAQGRRQEARARLLEAIAWLEPWQQDGSYELRRVHALCLHQYAALEGSPASHVDAKSALSELLAERPDDGDLRSVWLESSWVDVSLDRLGGDPTGALSKLDGLIEEARGLAAGSDSPDATSTLAMLVRKRSGLLDSVGRNEEARDASEEALELFRGIYDADPTRDDARAGVAKASSELGARLAKLGEVDAAMMLFEEAEPELSWLVESYPGDPAHNYLLAELFKNRGVTLNILRAPEEAEEALLNAAAEFEKIERRFPELGAHDLELAIVRINLGVVRADLGAYEEALSTLDQALAHVRSMTQRWPDDKMRASWWGKERIARANVLLKASRPTEAAAVLEKAPELVGTRVGQVEEALAHMVLALDYAREIGDDEALERIERSARLSLECARARGDSDGLPSMARLRTLLEGA